MQELILTSENVKILRWIIKTSAMDDVFSGAVMSVFGGAGAIFSQFSNDEKAADGGDKSRALEFCEHLARQEIASLPMYGRIFSKKGELLLAPSIAEEDRLLHDAERRRKKKEREQELEEKRLLREQILSSNEYTQDDGFYFSQEVLERDEERKARMEKNMQEDHQARQFGYADRHAYAKAVAKGKGKGKRSMAQWRDDARGDKVGFEDE